MFYTFSIDFKAFKKWMVTNLNYKTQKKHVILEFKSGRILTGMLFNFLCSKQGIMLRL